MNKPKRRSAGSTCRKGYVHQRKVAGYGTSCIRKSFTRTYYVVVKIYIYIFSHLITSPFSRILSFCNTAADAAASTTFFYIPSVDDDIDVPYTDGRVSFKRQSHHRGVFTSCVFVKDVFRDPQNSSTVL